MEIQDIHLFGTEGICIIIHHNLCVFTSTYMLGTFISLVHSVQTDPMQMPNQQSRREAFSATEESEAAANNRRTCNLIKIQESSSDTRVHLPEARSPELESHPHWEKNRRKNDA